METIRITQKPISDDKAVKFLSVSYGSGSGSGDGYGDGDGLKSYSNHKVYVIDNVPTILLGIKNNVANGYIINQDLTITKTFIVKVGNYFAHGDSIKSALNDAQAKFNDNLPDEAKIEMFLSEFNLVDKYDCEIFFNWHKTLTGSCEQGRLTFMKNKGIEFGEKFTVLEFLVLTKNEYNNGIINEIIKQINESGVTYNQLKTKML